MTFAQDLERTASRRGLELSNTYEFRFRRRYNLPPTDPRFLRATIEEIVVDYWAHAHLDDPKLREQDETDDFEAMLQAAESSIKDGEDTPIAMDPEVARRLREAKGQDPVEPAAPPPKVAAVVETTIERLPVPEDDSEEVFSDQYS